MGLQYCTDAYLRSVSCISESCLCTGSCLGSWWRNTECDHCTGSNRLAEICKTCKGADTGTERFALSDGSKMSGSSVPKILFKHILPNIAGQILVTAVLDIGTMMMELAGLSFLGLGVQPPAAEWGSMINDGRSMLQISPWMVLAPGVAIFITVMIFNLLGDTLRDYMDRKQRAKNKREEKNK